MGSPDWSWPSCAHRLRLSLLPALSGRGRPPTDRPPPAGGNGSTTQDRESISLPVALFPASRGTDCESAEGLLRRLVDVSRMKIPVPVRSWPRWSRRIRTRITNGIGHGHTRVFMKTIGDKAAIPKVRTPHRTPSISHGLASHPTGCPVYLPYPCRRRGRPARGASHDDHGGDSS